MTLRCSQRDSLTCHGVSGTNATSFGSLLPASCLHNLRDISGPNLHRADLSPFQCYCVLPPFEPARAHKREIMTCTTTATVPDEPPFGEMRPTLSSISASEPPASQSDPPLPLCPPPPPPGLAFIRGPFTPLMPNQHHGLVSKPPGPLLQSLEWVLAPNVSHSPYSNTSSNFKNMWRLIDYLPVTGYSPMRMEPLVGVGVEKEQYHASMP